VAASIAAISTLEQSVRHRRKARAGPAPPQPLAPLHRRFARNFRRTIAELPFYVTA
jgi:hypothetical protein